MGLDINGIGTSQANSSKTRAAPASRSSDQGSSASRSSRTAQDTVSISAEAKALSQLPELTKGAAFDSAKVESLRLAIENGTYKPDPGRIANAILKSDELF